MCFTAACRWRLRHNLLQNGVAIHEHRQRRETNLDTQVNPLVGADIRTGFVATVRLHLCNRSNFQSGYAKYCSALQSRGGRGKTFLPFIGPT